LTVLGVAQTIFGTFEFAQRCAEKDRNSDKERKKTSTDGPSLYGWAAIHSCAVFNISH
jgi:hypothetical protein